jgi:transposase
VGRSRGGLTTKIHARVDAKGRPVRLLISPGNDHDVTCAAALLKGLDRRAVVIADKGYDADSVRSCIRDQGAIPNIPNRSNRKKKFRWKKAIYRQRNHVERFFNKLKQFRRIATRYDKLGATFFAFIQLAAIRISLRSIESNALVSHGAQLHLSEAAVLDTRTMGPGQRHTFTQQATLKCNPERRVPVDGRRGFTLIEAIGC